jgi:hypothetical protein
LYYRLIDLKAVITGDIIQSTRLPSEQKMAIFNSIKKYLKLLGKNYTMKSEVFRGDSFQCLITDPADALRVALLIKTFIRSLNPTEMYHIMRESDKKKGTNTFFTSWIFDARLAIGIGKTELETKTLANSDGEAFYLSGFLLDDIKSSKQHFAIASNDKFSDEWKTESILLDAIIRRTTALQCEVINYKLELKTETEIANRLKIGQSAVNQRSNSGEWHAIEAMVDRFEKVYKK